MPSQQSVNEGVGSAQVSVRAITANGQPTTTAVPLNFATVAGSAAANVDYAHTVGGVSIAAGTPNGSLVLSAIGIVNDAVDEPAERFTLDLKTTAPGTSAVATETVVIQDTDPGPFGLAASGEAGDSTTHTSTTSAPEGAPVPVGEWKTEGVAAPSVPPLTWTTRPPASGESNRPQQPEGAGR